MGSGVAGAALSAAQVFCADSGGNSLCLVLQLVAAAGGSTQLDFFTMPEAKQLYMDRVKTIITRVNTITKQP